VCEHRRTSVVVVDETKAAHVSYHGHRPIYAKLIPHSHQFDRLFWAMWVERVIVSHYAGKNTAAY
jgi:hypothetical protein